MDLTSLLFPLLILLLFIPIFMSGRRQKRQAQEMQSLQKSLEVGDLVMTTSGLRGEVVDTDFEDTVDLEIAPGVVTTWVRAAVKNKIVDEPGAADLTDDDQQILDATPVDADPVDADRKPESTEPEPGPADAPDSPSPATPSLTKDESTNGTARS